MTITRSYRGEPGEAQVVQFPSAPSPVPAIMDQAVTHGRPLINATIDRVAPCGASQHL
jgi:hypothetical protein